MKNFNFKKLLPHLVAIVAFIILSAILCKPVFEGKIVMQHDTQQVKAMQEQSMEFYKQNGYYPRWTNSMFCGMPAYQIALSPKGGSITSVGIVNTILTLGLPKPVYFLFIVCFCFYLLGIVIGVNPWLSLLGAIGYAYCSYDPILISVGHDTKLLSMAYAPAVIASLILIFQKKYWLGAALMLIFMTCLLGQSHQQIVYYTFIICVFLVLHYIIKFIQEKEFTHILLSIGIAISLSAIALGICSLGYFSTYEYTKESMRGGASELTAPGKEKKPNGGLDKDYAFSWSYGKIETMSFIVPNACGGGSSTSLGEDSKVAELLQTSNDIPQQAKEQLYQAATAYWGGRPSTSGPVYFGAIISLLFLMGAVLSKSEHRWWILSVALLGILLAWGKYFSSFNYFLFDHLPFYNKFRTPEMALFIPQLVFPLLGILFLQELITTTDNEKLAEYGKKSLIITGSIVALLLGFYFFVDFKNDATLELKKNITNAFQNNNSGFIKDYFNALVTDRKALYLADMWRSLGFIIVAGAAIYLFTKKIIKTPILFIVLILLSTFDLFGVAKRFLSEDNFVEPSDYEIAYADFNADIAIKRDPGYFRIINLAFRDPNSGNFQASIGNAFNDAFNDAIGSYSHNNIGGYHPSKLGVFEDLKENQIYKNLEAWAKNPNAKDSFQVLNMLNMKYIILPDQKNPKQTIAQPNPYALGSCWLVKEIKFVKNANEEMDALNYIDPAKTVVIDERFKNSIPFVPSYDSTASIKLVENKNDDIKYDFNATGNQFAVFSEMYYSKGWTAYIDGKETPYCRVNYALRGLAIPSGKHSIEFIFDSKIVSLSEKIANYSSLLSLLIILICIYFIWKKKEISL